MLSQKQANNVLLKGWVTRKNLGSQDNSDRYTMHFDGLDQAQRCSVFTLFEGVSVYLIPITSQTKEFCRQMGIYPLKGKEGNNPEESTLFEETHYYAFLSQVRQSFTKRSSFQNPEVICHAHDMPKRSYSLPQQVQAPQAVQAPIAPTQALTGQVLKNEPVNGVSDVTQKLPHTVSDPRFQQERPALKEPPTVINLIHAAQPSVVKTEFGYRPM